MTNLQRHWKYLSEAHDLLVDIPYDLIFPDGHGVRSEVRLKGYGAPNGMIIVSDYSLIEDRSNEIVSLGYGYTCMSQPNENQIQSEDNLQEILDDWGKCEN